ncbi:MAG TPA: hypothetical protein VFW78_06550 [Bacteroidia bacterium]|nr:hypothetical protein [Bacteroidia bacterium]
MKLTALAGLFIVFVTSCSPSLNVIGVWSDKSKAGTKTYSKLFIFAITSNLSVQSAMESEMAAAAAQRGLGAVKSADVMPATFRTTGKISREELKKIITDNGCDGVVTFTVLDQKEKTRYVPGTASYAPMGYGMYDPFYGYYNYYQPTVYTPGYYTTDKVYFLESNFYDVETESMLWSVQSESVNPDNIKSFSKQYVHTLLSSLKKNNIIKK